MSTLSKIRFRNGTPYILPPKIYKGDELVYDISEVYLDFSTQYFTIESLEDNNIISFTKNSYSAPNITYYWSINDGMTWTSYNDTTNQTLNSGQKLLMKCICNQFATLSDQYWHFSSTKMFNVSGNIMSLLYGDNFAGQINLPDYENVFNSLFYNCTNLISAENLVMPSTVLHKWCYGNMFSGCTSLTVAPILPATTLAGSCYERMFEGCSSLIAAPILPATTLANGCYTSMFRNCTTLTIAPKLPVATLVPWCYQSMFQGCSSLNNITCLATDKSASNCVWTWVQGVASSGTFVKAASMNNWSIGDSGIPEGWTIQDYN